MPTETKIMSESQGSEEEIPADTKIMTTSQKDEDSPIRVLKSDSKDCNSQKQLHEKSQQFFSPSSKRPPLANVAQSNKTVKTKALSSKGLGNKKNDRNVNKIVKKSKIGNAVDVKSTI